MTQSAHADMLPWHKSLLYQVTNWGLFAAGLVNLGVGTCAAWNEHVAIAGTSLTAGLVLLFAATVDRFESIKGLGVEAKTRQLDKKIEQADEALKRLRELAELVGSSVVDLNSKVGRWNGAPTPDAAFEHAERVRSILKNLGSSDATIRAAMQPWVEAFCGDVVAALADPIHVAVSARVRELEQRRQSLATPLSPMDPDFLALTASINAAGEFLGRFKKLRTSLKNGLPEALAALVAEVPLVSKETQKELSDKVHEYLPGLRELIESHSLAQATKYIALVNAHRNRYEAMAAE